MTDADLLALAQSRALRSHAETQTEHELACGVVDLFARLDESIHSPVLQAVLDAIKGTLDPHTQIADHPNVKFAQMERLKWMNRPRADTLDYAPRPLVCGATRAFQPLHGGFITHVCMLPPDHPGAHHTQEGALGDVSWANEREAT